MSEVAPRLLTTRTDRFVIELFQMADLRLFGKRSDYMRHNAVGNLLGELLRGSPVSHPVHDPHIVDVLRRVQLFSRDQTGNRLRVAGMRNAIAINAAGKILAIKKG